MEENDLPGILQRLKRQAQLVNSINQCCECKNTWVKIRFFPDKNLTSNWDVGLLQKELEGECHMLKVLHAKNATLFGRLFIQPLSYLLISLLYFTLDTCKARSANRKLMTKKRKRIDAIVSFLGEKGIIVSNENVDSGIFPWHNNRECMCFNSFPLIISFIVFFCSVNCGRLRTHRHLDVMASLSRSNCSDSE